MDLQSNIKDLYVIHKKLLLKKKKINPYKEFLNLLLCYVTFYNIILLLEELFFQFFIIISLNDFPDLIIPTPSKRNKENYFFKTNYKFENVLKTLVTKFIRSGRRYLVERVMNQIFCRNRSFFFFFYLFEVIELLRPVFYLRILIFQRRGKQRSVKKGTKVKKRTKVIPVKINYIKSYKVSFMWLVKSILKQNKSLNAEVIMKETYTTYFSKRSGA
jgi:hypothetical protein